MGLSFEDLATLSREPTALYPSMDPLPVLSALSPADKEDIRHQIDFENKMRASAYYIVESKKSTDLPRYSDKYRPTAAAQPTLKRKDLNPAFFPPEIFEGFFNPKKKRKLGTKKVKKTKANFDDLEREEQEGDGDEDDDEDKQRDGEEEDPDYDQDEEEDDNDYVEEYFDNGEADDDDYLGGPRGGDDGGGGDTYD
ncbi:DNA-directed RNA polymerase III, subunit Rpc31 [Gautieria morchelliformis]|nr:DNA-directed RNA polymerase III, subunit Rpc31 [Gautieria morchelliformis]